MKKLNRILFATLALAGLVFASCTDKEKPEPDSVKTAGTFTQAELGAAVQTMYAQWTKDTTIPETLSVADKSLNQSEYFYAMAKFVTNVVNGDNSDIAVKTYKAASHPERDSYDSKTIAVVNGPKDGNGVTEDLATIAAAMLKEAEESAQIPNRALVYRGSEALAFSTNRAIVCFARAIDAYVADGAFPSEISTDYLSANATLKAFAQEFVSYLDVWEANVAETLSADGSRCSDNKTAWENVHFIPIPHSGGNYADGVDQYQDIYKPYHTITVDGVEYSAAQCWVIAMKGLLDICTLEGSKTQQTSRNEIVHTLGNGESMSMAIPTVEDWGGIWGKYPWYEHMDDGGFVKYNGNAMPTCKIGFMVRTGAWHLTRSSQLGYIGNFQQYGEDPASNLVEPGYNGLISSMREFLIAARIYKYILDNNISENVYDAIKDVEFDTDLYNQQAAKIEVSETNLTSVFEGATVSFDVTAQAAWTAATEADWLSVSPASGAAGTTTVTVTVAANTGSSRTGEIALTCDSKTVTVSIVQDAKPAEATIRDLAKEYAKLIDIWTANVGTCSYTMKIDAIGSTGDENDVPDAHYLPADTKITLNGISFNLADIFELGGRCYLLLRGFNGNDTENYGAGKIAALEGSYTMDGVLPLTHSYTWGTTPWGETKGNGGELRTTDDREIVRIDLLDNVTMRSLNFKSGKPISNTSSYSNRLDGYKGSCCPMRAIMLYAEFFKYMLDNNLSDARSIDPSVEFTSRLFK